MKKLFLSVVLLFTSSSVLANPVSTMLTKWLLDTKTMEANFTQTIRDKSAHSIQQTSGHMALIRPGKFYWEVFKPAPQLIISNNGKLWIYDKDLQQVTIRQFSKAAGQTPALLLSDANIDLTQDYNISQKPVSSQIAGSANFTLTPKDEDDAFESITLNFVNKHIEAMLLKDRLGHLTTIRFNHVKVGGQLPAALFTFKAGPNVDVIDETKTKK